MNCRTGEVQGKTALMFAGSGSGNIRAAGIELSLPLIGAVSGNPIKT